MQPVLPDALAPTVQAFLELLERWNRTHALTALPLEVRFEELILDACALLPHLPQGPGRVVDFGTGMGIPAVVLAAARPDLEVVALDKARKKVAFVRQAALELGLSNLRPLHGRAELLTPLEADVGTAKAVGDLDLLLGWWQRHGRPGAPFLALKGSPESQAPEGWRLSRHPYSLPTRGERSVLRLVKVG